ncbi:MAG: hypothetical protein U0V48_10360 [Anaerolineales bacterium]
MQKKQSRGKLTTIILITLGAAFVLYAILAPQLPGRRDHRHYAARRPARTSVGLIPAT